MGTDGYFREGYRADSCRRHSAAASPGLSTEDLYGNRQLYKPNSG